MRCGDDVRLADVFRDEHSYCLQLVPFVDCVDSRSVYPNPMLRQCGTEGIVDWRVIGRVKQVQQLRRFIVSASMVALAEAADEGVLPLLAFVVREKTVRSSADHF